MISLILFLFLLSCGHSLAYPLSSKWYPIELPQADVVPLQILQKILDPFIRAPQKPVFILKVYPNNLSSSPVAGAYIGFFSTLSIAKSFSSLLHDHLTPLDTDITA